MVRLRSGKRNVESAAASRPWLVAFRAAFILSTFLASFITYGVCRAVRLKRVPVIASIDTSTAACAVLGFFCSAAAVWSEIRFGGVDVSFHWSTALSNMTGGAFVLVAWCTIYSGAKQYQALQVEQERLRADVECRHLTPETVGLGLSNTRERLTQIYGMEAFDTAGFGQEPNNLKR